MKNIFLIFLSLSYALSSFAEQSGTSSTADNNTPAAVAPAPVKEKKAAPKSAMVNLEAAYKREYAFLAAQKKELSARLKQYKKKAAVEERKMEQKIDQLEQSTVDNAALIDSIDSQLSEAERNATAMDERSEVLDMTFNQAETTLEGYSIEITKAPEYQADESQKIALIFSEAIQLINKLGAVHSKDGKFFLRDGKQTQGKIITLGNIAAYGVSDKGSGALAPAGGEHFKLWKEPTDNIAEGLASNAQPDVLKVFLFESKSKAIEEHAEKTWLSIIESGGIIGWVIVILGGVGVLLILIRCFLLFNNSRDTKAVSSEVVALVDKGDLPAAKSLCNQKSSAITRVMASTLKHLKDDRDHMDDIISEAILNESGPINKYGPAILVIASVAPLLGLLGTVTGMISTFDIITEFGTGDPKLLSSGISVALVTTELGLIVAIPTLLFGSLLGAWANNIRRDMEISALTITNSVLGDADGEIARIINDQSMGDKTQAA